MVLSPTEDHQRSDKRAPILGDSTIPLWRAAVCTQIYSGVLLALRSKSFDGPQRDTT